MFTVMMSTDASSEPTEELGSRLLTRLGIGTSILIHMTVLLWLVFGTGVRMFESPPPEEAISLELVTPEAAEPRKEEAQTDAEEKKKNDTLTQLDLTIPKPSLSDNAVKPAPPTAEAKQESPAPAKQAAPPPAPAQPNASFTMNAPAVAQPDITEKYGTMFNLSETGYSGDTMAAKIEAGAVDTFRAHLRKCSKMPPNVTAADKVKIVLRIALTPDGHLISAPALIEASASPKGPYLMQAAIKALQACQPYDMLPADKYKEWRVLDLGFTPQDFTG